MNPKQFDHIENRIREAAEKNLPAFEEAMWNDMENLLNKQEKGKRRRGIIFFWVLPVAAVLTGLAIYFSSMHHTGILTPENRAKQMKVDKSKGPVSSSYEKTQGSNAGIISSPLKEKRVAQQPVKHSVTMQQNDAIIPGNIIQRDKEEKNEIIVSEKKNTEIAEKEKEVARILPASPAINDTTTVITSTEKKQKKSVAASRFYIVGYGGVENNAVNLSLKGNATAMFGIGVGYAFNKKWSIQTGFFAGKKKYNADASEYSIKPGSYLSTVDVKNIDADCFVFDIPIAVRYNFFQRKQRNIYATAGLSSYIMNKEIYEYYYYRSGTPGTYNRTYTHNRHLFSVATVSIGYEQKITPRFSLQVEPFIKTPLSGIGEGKVKLYSTGLLFGIKYNLPGKK